MKVTLKLEEFETLQEAINSEKINPSFQVGSRGKDLFYLDASEDEICELREACEGFLQVVGFDRNYTPTRRGEILETLIDKLYVP